MMARTDDVRELLAELRNATDRNAVVVGAAFVDDLLRELLESSMLPKLVAPKEADPLFAPDRPLGPFGARSQLAFRLGLISGDTLNALSKLGKLRNAAAHMHQPFDLSASPHKEHLRDLSSKLGVPPEATFDSALGTERGEFFCCLFLLMVDLSAAAKVAVRPAPHVASPPFERFR